MDTEKFFVRDKILLRLEALHWSQPSTELKNVRDNTSTLPYASMLWCLIKFKDQLTYISSVAKGAYFLLLTFHIMNFLIEMKCALNGSEQRFRSWLEFGSTWLGWWSEHQVSWLIFPCFIQSLQAIASIVSLLSPDRFLPNPFKFNIHISSYHSTLCGIYTDIVVKQSTQLMSYYRIYHNIFQTKHKRVTFSQFGRVEGDVI
jgi:hypothetical protein